MKIYGTGYLKAPLTMRIVWDFANGPFDTVNPDLIQAAKKQGFSLTPPVEPVPKDTPKKRGKPKGAKNVNAKTNTAKRSRKKV